MPADFTAGSLLSEFSQICIITAMQISSSTDALARFGHALSDPTRTRVLLALREGPAYPADLAELAGVTRQAMSNHLACLRGCGLVVAVPEGRRSRYELADARIGHALGDLIALALVVDPTCRGGENVAEDLVLTAQEPRSR
jgi:DNA-binding transcriptional ArsR family regulator